MVIAENPAPANQRLLHLATTLSGGAAGARFPRIWGSLAEPPNQNYYSVSVKCQKESKHFHVIGPASISMGIFNYTVSFWLFGFLGRLRALLDFC